ncbi:MAG TPA: DUF2807 domain-containing protein [Acidimicrobiia bacterium]|nr:DUF2807 domain-containing protein [Acidimicrobiia bacterium]
MRLSRCLALLAITAALLACGPVGSGEVVSEPREVGDFGSIQVSGGIDLVLTVDGGADPSVTVVYDENLLDRIETVVDGGTLVIRSRGSFSVLSPGRRVEVTTTTLEELSSSGGSDVEGSGAVDSLVLGASGGSDIDLSNLAVGSLVVTTSGGSDVTVNVTDEIVGDASGGSNLTILGEPSIQRVNVSGGAEVRNR